ncbi:MAG: sulfotransferase, partial [Lysobacterales bacterium]
RAWREANDEVAAQRPFMQAAWRNLAHTLRSIRDVPRADSIPEGPSPVFIVGMPRSGSTLVEQILGAHSAVQATSELPFIDSIARSLDRQGGFAARLPMLGRAACTRAAASYLAQARPFLDVSAPYFTDKWPNNFWYIGLIRALFPEAPVINVMRDPLDNAIGVYRQYFNQGNEHSFRLEWTADYWEIYLDVMQFWESLFPGQVLHLSYRDLVTGPENAARRIFHHCGLPFEAETLDFHRRERTVMTPSAQQVRQPIYTSALDSSRPYRPFIEQHLPRFAAIAKKAGTLPGL